MSIANLKEALHPKASDLTMRYGRDAEGHEIQIFESGGRELARSHPATPLSQVLAELESALATV